MIGRPQLSLSALYNRHLVREAPSILAHSSHPLLEEFTAAVQRFHPHPHNMADTLLWLQTLQHRLLQTITSLWASGKKRRVSSDQESPRKRLRKAKEPIEEVLEARGSKRKATDMVVDTDSCFSIDDSSITSEGCQWARTEEPDASSSSSTSNSSSRRSSSRGTATTAGQHSSSSTSSSSRRSSSSSNSSQKKQQQRQQQQQQQHQQQQQKKQQQQQQQQKKQQQRQQQQQQQQHQQQQQKKQRQQQHQQQQQQKKQQQRQQQQRSSSTSSSSRRS
ncbi:hypothetical protein INR49_023163, partial [Caranx melampygus]